MFKGYCFTSDGFHAPAVELENEEAAVRYAMLQKGLHHEVRIVDESDSIVLQTIKGKVVYPTRENMFKFSEHGIENKDLFCSIYSGFVDYCKGNFPSGTFSTYCDGEPVFIQCGFEFSYSRYLKTK